MKFSPVQIGILSDIIKTAITNHPLGENFVEKTVLSEEIKMEDWECFVRGAVNSHPQMPNYEELQSEYSDIYEFLVEYYSKGIW